MNLFINAVSSSGMLILFDNTKKIIHEHAIEIRGNESSKLTATIDDFLKKSKLNYDKIDNIIVVNGPGSFTGVRAICLLVNTIAFSTKCKLTSMSYFDLFDNYPIAKQSSKRDMFFQSSAKQEVEIKGNEEIVLYLKKNNITTLYGETPAGWEGEIIENINYYDIISHIIFDDCNQIDPLYLKKPNIC